MVDQPLHFTPPPPPRTPGQPSERLIIVSGLSGAGKTVALRTLEDLDYYCVDNLPTALLPSFVDAVRAQGHYPRLAVGVEVLRQSTHHAARERDFVGVREQSPGQVGLAQFDHALDRDAVEPGPDRAVMVGRVLVIMPVRAEQQADGELAQPVYLAVEHGDGAEVLEERDGDKDAAEQEEEIGPVPIG